MIIYQHIDNSKINARANQKLDNPEKLEARARACVRACVCVRAKGIKKNISQKRTSFLTCSACLLKNRCIVSYRRYEIKNQTKNIQHRHIVIITKQQVHLRYICDITSMVIITKQQVHLRYICDITSIVIITKQQVHLRNVSVLVVW
jgi:hypothetical protein